MALVLNAPQRGEGSAGGFLATSAHHAPSYSYVPPHLRARQTGAPRAPMGTQVPLDSNTTLHPPDHDGWHVRPSEQGYGSGHVPPAASSTRPINPWTGLPISKRAARRRRARARNAEERRQQQAASVTGQGLHQGFQGDTASRDGSAPLAVFPVAVPADEGPVHTAEDFFAALLSQQRISNALCSICFDAPSEYPSPAPTSKCTHEPAICAPCLEQHISHAVQDQGLTTIICPVSECRCEMEYADVIRGARENQACLDRYEALLLRRMLENEPTFVWCKNATCGWGQVHDGGDDAPIVICQACHARACFTHDVPWHTDLTCEQYTAQIESRDTDNRASQAYVDQHAKICPNNKCGRRIEKADGCDHMTCRRPAGCGHQFCWVCLADYAPIRDEGNHHHRPTCPHYAAIDQLNPFELRMRELEELNRRFHRLHEPPAAVLEMPLHPTRPQVVQHYLRATRPANIPPNPAVPVAPVVGELNMRRPVVPLPVTQQINPPQAAPEAAAPRRITFWEYLIWGSGSTRP